MPGRAVAALDLALVRRAAGALPGEHRGLGVGLGTELAQLRPYQLGDDVRQLDPAASARTGVPARPPADPRARAHHVARARHLAVDGLRHRRAPEVRRRRGRRARVARLGVRRGGRIALLTCGSPVVRVLPPRGGRRAIGPSSARSPRASRATAPPASRRARRGAAAVAQHGAPARASCRSSRTSATRRTGSASCARSARATACSASRSLDPRETELRRRRPAWSLVDPEDRQPRGGRHAREARCARRSPPPSASGASALRDDLRRAGARHVVLTHRRRLAARPGPGARVSFAAPIFLLALLLVPLGVARRRRRAPAPAPLRRALPRDGHRRRRHGAHARAGAGASRDAAGAGRRRAGRRAGPPAGDGRRAGRAGHGRADHRHVALDGRRGRGPEPPGGRARRRAALPGPRARRAARRPRRLLLHPAHRRAPDPRPRQARRRPRLARGRRQHRDRRRPRRGAGHASATVARAAEESARRPRSSCSPTARRPRARTRSGSRAARPPRRSRSTPWRWARRAAASPAARSASGCPSRRTPRRCARSRAITGGEAFTVDDRDELDRIYERVGSQVGTKSERREITAGFAGAGFVLLAVACSPGCAGAHGFRASAPPEGRGGVVLEDGVGSSHRVGDCA